MSGPEDQNETCASYSERVQRLIDKTPVVDIHTHTFDPAMGKLLLWGIDELLTYHYLVAEFFRMRPDMDCEAFFAMSKRAQADMIWHELFVLHTPVSEACRGVLTVIQRLGLDAGSTDLRAVRAYFDNLTVTNYVDTVFSAANIREVTMTNDPLDPGEAVFWEKGFERDARFHASLRLDSALIQWPSAVPRLRALGYDVSERLEKATFVEIRRYLEDWSRLMRARYMAISLPPSFRYPRADSSVTTLLRQTVLPVARENDLPLVMMIGVKRLTNPALQMAGDSVGKSDVATLENLALDYPRIRFAVTMLSRENAHELCVAARKFSNITPFGCWWFLNNPSLIREITSMRLETLGLSFIPQNSDARVLDQLIYKWEHSRRIIGKVLAEKYADLPRYIDDKTIQRDLHRLFSSPIPPVRQSCSVQIPTP